MSKTFTPVKYLDKRYVRKKMTEVLVDTIICDSGHRAIAFNGFCEACVVCHPYCLTHRVVGHEQLAGRFCLLYRHPVVVVYGPSATHCLKRLSATPEGGQHIPPCIGLGHGLPDLAFGQGIRYDDQEAQNAGILFVNAVRFALFTNPKDLNQIFF